MGYHDFCFSSLLSPSSSLSPPSELISSTFLLAINSTFRKLKGKRSGCEITTSRMLFSCPLRKLTLWTVSANRHKGYYTGPRNADTCLHRFHIRSKYTHNTLHSCKIYPERNTHKGITMAIYSGTHTHNNIHICKYTEVTHWYPHTHIHIQTQKHLQSGTISSWCVHGCIHKYTPPEVHRNRCGNLCRQSHAF